MQPWFWVFLLTFVTAQCQGVLLRLDHLNNPDTLDPPLLLSLEVPIDPNQKSYTTFDVTILPFSKHTGTVWVQLSVVDVLGKYSLF